MENCCYIASPPAGGERPLDTALTPKLQLSIRPSSQKGTALYLVCVATVKSVFFATGSGGGENRSVRYQSSTISKSQMSRSFLKLRLKRPMLKIQFPSVLLRTSRQAACASARTRLRLGFSTGDMSFARRISSDCDRTRLNNSSF